MSEYKFRLSERILYRIALNFQPLAELLFDIDQQISASKIDVDSAQNGRHVFISGLARSGTTVLLHRLYSTGRFTSLTYEQMPFVLAPNLLPLSSIRDRGSREPIERAHGDGIMVTPKSPEALDEVYWRVFDRENYIQRDFLQRHDPSPQHLKRFSRFVAAILAADRTKKGRYLSKNNNNVLRLPSLVKTFTNSMFLIPFRHPLSHIDSLIRQDKRFRLLQEENSFVRTYMNALAHHEFGLDHRPFCFDSQFQSERFFRPDDWLRYWIRTYSWLLENESPQVVFVSYEALCEDPRTWLAIASLADIDPNLGDGSDVFFSSNRSTNTEIKQSALDEAMILYDKLSIRSI